MSKVTKRTKRIAITTSVMLALGGGAAIAYWSATGNGAVNTAAGWNKRRIHHQRRSDQAGGLTPGGPGADRHIHGQAHRHRHPATHRSRSLP